MADLSLNCYLMQGTNAARVAATPSPAAPAAGPELLPLWYETDTGNTYAWDTSGAGAWVQIAAAALGSVTSVDVSGGTTGLTTSGGPVTTSGTITLAGTLAVANGGTGITAFGTGVATALGINVGTTGALVAQDGALGTPSSGTLTNATGLPISTGVSGLGTNVATFLGTPSSANLASAVTDETGSGALVFATSPTLVTPALGTPASGTLTNCTGPWGSQQLAQVVTASSASTITFSSISGSYTTLVIVVEGRDTNTGSAEINARLKINSDSTAGNYTTASLTGNASGSAVNATNAATTAGGFVWTCPGTSSNANAIGWATIIIPNYSRTAFHKGIAAQTSASWGGTPSQSVYTVGWVWKNTAAITDLVLTAGGTAFVDGTTATLYGLK